MLNVGRNQHRWKKWIGDDRVRSILEQAAENLKWAWTVDEKDPKSYPVHTSHVLGQIEQQLRQQPSARTITVLPDPVPLPQSLSELVDERTIRAIYEDQNDGSYEDALREAAGFEGASAWRKILRAVDLAYEIDNFGIAAPKPRVHFLHRSLLALVNSADLHDMSLEGVVEFFDDICPCGKRHNPDAIRKLRKRWVRTARKPP
ncbi:MAG TPA: hypothetical protein VEI52_25745 [Terriglobales bacterium]|nr:hypothetical protein [Terriglobales bacterium]